MTTLSLAARNSLVQVTTLVSLVARSEGLGTWIFDQSPLNAKIEGTGKCLIVINEGRPWATPNGHNTLRFPTLEVDVWADSTRNGDGSVKIDDARRKIERIQKEVDQVLHRVDSGGYIMLGTSAQLAAKTGVVVASSKSASSTPDYSKVTDSEGSWMGRLRYNLELL